MFNSFISLGWQHGTAASMAKYGLRSASGPFDWCSSDLKGVLHFMETDFEDFLDQNHLQVNFGNPKIIVDEKYGLKFSLDVKKDFAREYPHICEKYMCHVENFRKQIAEGACFIRAVHNKAELEYIAENAEYIERVVKRANHANEIIFLIPYYMNVPKHFFFPYYMLKIGEFISSRLALKNLFDTNKEFISFCIDNMDENTRRENLEAAMREEQKHRKAFME